ncbi:hypothetical protein HD596_004163 [Nonomuraea jabiensis]|uniref:Uncharacterized protein n=1 Tax=Nonomuraea jabiensis TaxID=882448 RepID=A0A7W9G523_9ACTN|nr:hypothetical protein [Nonomuraea jabiensis]
MTVMGFGEEPALASNFGVVHRVVPSCVQV